ncbi:hypothetical protein [Ottowia thiooxydans]|uniref:hypothetical protein n=1 Tax=Ottowia thiooxydans TaxID=219182 RepID=UPI0003FE9494|nr:hypothetical protein [Ottowia thiooxydans]
MTLEYLIFDYCEDEHGIGNWDAMASVSEERVPAMATEIEQVLRWASQEFPGSQYGLDDGGDWDYDLQVLTEGGQPLPASFDSGSGKLLLAPPPAGRTTATLSLAGSTQFFAAFTTWLSENQEN